MKAINIIAAAAILVAPSIAQAQEQCGPVQGMEQHFLDNFGERIVTELVNPEGNILVLMVNDDTQSWTLIIHDGTIGCIIAVGQGVNSLLPVGMAL